MSRRFLLALNIIKPSALELIEKRREYIKSKYFLQDYHIGFLKEISNLSLRNKQILEVGGSNFPSEVLFDYFGVKKWVCIDYLEFWGDRNGLWKQQNSTDFAVCPLSQSSLQFDSHRYIKFDGDANNMPTFFHGQFDVVISCCAFEHIQQLEGVAKNIYYAIKPGGEFYTSFSPIWSGSLGHHTSSNGDGWCNRCYEDGVPPFVHLLWTEQQTREYFTEHPLPPNQLDNLIEYSYHTNLINRLFYEDYERIVKSVFGEKNVSVKPIIWGPEVTPQVMSLLLQKYPNYKRFDAQGMTIKAVK